MIQETTFRKLLDYVLLNACMVNSSGLYNGKAGLSLSLFAVADYLQDEQLEEKAFRLLQESLIDRNKDTGFENGLAGIGYALLYLIENQLLEADFDEVFGEQYEEIIRSYENIDKEPLKLVNSLQVIYYFSQVNRLKSGDDRPGKIIKKILEGLELFLILHFYDFTDIYYVNNKMSVLTIFDTYLQLVDYSGYNHFSHGVLEEYASLYRKDRIVSSLIAGIYLNKITGKYQLTGYRDVIAGNITGGISNVFPEDLSLKERITLATIINHPENKELIGEEQLPDLTIPDKEGVIPYLVKMIDKKSSPVGYGAGLGRLLFYWADKQAEMV